MRLDRNRVSGVCACLCVAAVGLTACFRAEQPVHFFAEGRPVKLSDWRVVYADGRNLALNAGVVPYDLNTPLFSDYAHKLRTIWMPPGQSARYNASGNFDFPVGTIISKTFYYPLPAGFTTRCRRVRRAIQRPWRARTISRTNSATTPRASAA
jgi:hypothetical protein